MNALLTNILYFTS